MTDPIVALLRNVLRSYNDVNPAIALFGAGATDEQSKAADQIARYAYDRGYVESTGISAVGEDLIRVRVTPAGEQYLAEHGG